MSSLLHEVFSESVERFPDSTAIVAEDGVSWTYRELDELSNHIAAHLRDIKRSSGDGPYVGIISNVHAESIAAVLAILSAGYAYVPLDLQSPPDRLQIVVERADLDVLIIDAAVCQRVLPILDCNEVKKVVILGDASAITHPKCEPIRPLENSRTVALPKRAQISDDLAYILHSSGSTGVPKGIMLTHRNARTFVDWMHKEFQLTTADRVMARSPFKFDLSVFDIFNTFRAGATLLCFDWSRKRTGDRTHADFVSFMKRGEATILYATPSTLIALMNRGELGRSRSSLRTIMYAGEPFQIAQLRKFRQAVPQARIANIYGPTETNIITCYWVDEIPADETTSIPLGTEVDDTEIRIVSDDGTRICHPDEIGEIWCRGGTVTCGYLGLEQLTAERLIQSPWHSYPARFWRTGDYGFRDANGVLHYRGRRDDLVKVKGYRIELGEIESAAAAYPQIDEVAAVAISEHTCGKRIICYFSMKESPSASESLECFLRRKLPRYMIPSDFILLNEIPKTSSGKVDRSLLAQLGTE